MVQNSFLTMENLFKLPNQPIYWQSIMSKSVFFLKWEKNLITKINQFDTCDDSNLIKIKFKMPNLPYSNRFALTNVSKLIFGLLKFTCSFLRKDFDMSSHGAKNHFSNSFAPHFSYHNKIANNAFIWYLHISAHTHLILHRKHAVLS